MRVTQHLDLTSDTAQSELDRTQALETLLQALRKRRKIVVIAGAGISVAAGIPDFRSSHGLFRSLRAEHKLKSSGKELFDASVYKDDSSTSSFHDMVRKLSVLSQDAKPTAFHRLLARLSQEGRLLRLYTQNVDGLESKLPPLVTEVPLRHKAPWPKTIQLHGGLEKMMCQKCRQISDFDQQLFQGSVPPHCPECLTRDNIRTEHAGKRSHGVGRLRPRIVLYNEHNPDDEAIGAVTTADFRTRPDAVIVVGTSMKIPAVRRITAEMCKIVRDRKDGTTIWINHDPEPTGKDLEDCWDLIVKADADEIAHRACFKEWDDATPDIIEAFTDSDVEQSKTTQGRPNIVIASPRKEELKAPATPPLSPRPIDPADHRFTPQPAFTINVPLIPPQQVPQPKMIKPAASKYKPLNVISGITTKPKTKTVTKSTTSKPRSVPKGRRVENGQASMMNMVKVTKKTPGIVLEVKKDPAILPLAPRRDSISNVQPEKIVKAELFSSAGSSPLPGSPGDMMVATPPTQVNEPVTLSAVATYGGIISPKGNIPRGMGHLID
jgi:NAD+-dependent protein deacetylase SIR2